MDESSQQMSVRLDGSKPSSGSTPQEQLGRAIMEMKDWFPGKSASWRADRVMSTDATSREV
jgi:hypothetical protein